MQFETTQQSRDAVAAWIAAAHLKPEQFLFPSRVTEELAVNLKTAREIGVTIPQEMRLRADQVIQ